MTPARGPLTDRTRQEIIESVSAYMREAELSQSDVARAVGANTTYVNNVLTETGSIPPETRDQLLRDLNNWLDREVRAKENRKPTTYVETRVARRLIDLAERLTERPDMAIAYGPAGIGKTLTCQAIAAELPTTVYVMVDDDCRSPTGLRDKLYNALARRKRARRIRLDEIIEKLRLPARVNTVCLVIVDEAHDLREGAFTLLRKLHEQARCSVLLLGTVDLKKRLSADDDPEFGQLCSRIGMKINLARELSGGPGGGARDRLFTVPEIRALFHAAKLKLHPAAARLLAMLANTARGTLRTVERVHFWALKEALRVKAQMVLPAHIRVGASIVDVDLPADDAPVPAEERAAEAATQEAAG